MHLGFPISTKNKHLVEDVKISIPLKFNSIPLTGLREVENVSVNQRPERQTWFYDRPKNTNMV